MTKVTLEIADDIPLTHKHSDAALQTVRVANAMGRWFGTDVTATVAVEKKDDEVKNVLTFKVTGRNAEGASKQVAFFMENSPELKGAFIKPTQVEAASGDQPIKMDLDKLSKMREEAFNIATFEAGQNAALVASHVNAATGQQRKL